MHGTDASALRDALQQQADDLSAVIRRFASVRDFLQAEHRLEWRGVAQLAYSLARGDLAARLVIASQQLETALGQTRRAIDSLGSRVG